MRSSIFDCKSPMALLRCVRVRRTFHDILGVFQATTGQRWHPATESFDTPDVTRGPWALGQGFVHKPSSPNTGEWLTLCIRFLRSLFPAIAGTPIAGWFVWESLGKKGMNYGWWLGVPLFPETFTCIFCLPMENHERPQPAVSNPIWIQQYGMGHMIHMGFFPFGRELIPYISILKHSTWLKWSWPNPRPLSPE